MARQRQFRLWVISWHQWLLQWRWQLELFRLLQSKSSSKRVKARAMQRVASLRKVPSSKRWAWFMPGNGWHRRRCLPTQLRVPSSTPWTMRSGLTPSDPYEQMMLVGLLRLLHIARHNSNSLSSCSSSRTDWLRLQSCRTQRLCRVMLIR